MSFGRNTCVFSLGLINTSCLKFFWKIFWDNILAQVARLIVRKLWCLLWEPLKRLQLHWW